MSFEERLQELVYTSPSGRSFSPTFRSLSRSNEKKTSVTELPQQNFPVVIDLGEGARSLDLEVRFNGPDYDQEADAFWDALSEKGFGQLQHPRWGTFPAMPLGKSQEENLQQAIYESVFRVEFLMLESEPEQVNKVETTESTSGAMAGESRELESGLSISLDSLLSSETAEQFREISATVAQQANALRESIGPLLAGIEAAGEFATLIGRMVDSPDDVVSSPRSLAVFLFAAMALTRRSESSTREKSRQFKTLIDNATAQLPQNKRIAGVKLATIGAAFSGMAESVTTGAIRSRSESASTIADIGGAFDSVYNYQNDIFRAFPSVDILPPAYLETQKNQYGLAVRALFVRSENLALGRKLLLDETIPPLNLVYRLYGSFERFDEFAEQNNLAGLDFLLLPAGREIRYLEQLR